MGKGVTGPVRGLRRFGGPRYYLAYALNLESGGIFFAVSGELLIMILSGMSGGR
jgi:Na+/alanine symporter